MNWKTVIRQGLHHGLASTPFDYPYCSANAFFRKALGKTGPVDLCDKNQEYKFLPHRKTLPESIGLNAIIIRAFNREEVKVALGLELEPLAVLAVGKGTEKIELVEVPAGSDLRYYRRDGIHFVPKISISDLLL